MRRIGLTAAGVLAGCAIAALAYAQGDTGTGRGHHPTRQDDASTASASDAAVAVPPSDGQIDGKPSVTLPPCLRPMSVKVDLSTGTTNGSTNPAGAVDPKWKIVSSPATSGVIPPNTYSIHAYNNNNGTWALQTSLPPATWINPWNPSPGFEAKGSTVNGTYKYDLTFYVPPGYTNINVSGRCRADDAATIALNGSANCGGFSPSGAAGAFNFNGTAGANNTLSANVQNTGGGPTGLIVQATLTAECKPTPPPPRGDHYLCYNVNKPWNANVTLNDQFGPFQFHVFAITRLCNPVEKRYNGRISYIANKNLHYVCYRGETHGISRTVVVNNQFGATTLTVKGPTELCLPSSKTEIHGPDSTGQDRRE